MNVATLSFRNFSAVSLPSGTYLFFPALRPNRKSHAHDREEPEELTRVVLGAGAEGSTQNWSGIVAGKTLYVDVVPDIYRRLWSNASGRDLRRTPVCFEIALDEREDLDRLVIDGEEISPYQTETGSRVAESA